MNVNDGVNQAGREADKTAVAERADEQGLLFTDDVSPLPSDTGYRGPTACNAAGITYRQLDYWARTGLVEPTVRGATGSGTQRLYSFRDILILKVIKRLLDAGISLQQIRTAVQHLRKRATSSPLDVRLARSADSRHQAHRLRSYGVGEVDLLLLTIPHGRVFARRTPGSERRRGNPSPEPLRRQDRADEATQKLDDE